MDTPRPGPAHARLMRFAGRESLDGMALVQDYEEEKDGAVVFHGHGVFLVEPDTQDVLWWWFDSMGFPPEPARGTWDGDVLLFDKSTPRGDARYRYQFDGNDRYRFTIENRFPGQAEFVEFMHGDYERVP